MAVTFRQLINRVLRVLGEPLIPDSANEITGDYNMQVATFVNYVKEEVEDAHQWRALRQTIAVTVPPGDPSESVVIPGTNERSRLYREYNQQWGKACGLVFDVTTTSEFQIWEMDISELRRRQTLDPATVTLPTWYAIDDTSGDTLSILLWPKPAAQRTIEVTLIIPQERISDSSLDTVITVPTRPIELGALWWAFEERGEELGTRALFSETKFRNALDDAVSRDAAEQGGYELVPV